MASNCNIDDGWFKSNRPHFFKIILQETITDGKLRIPRKFVRDYGNDLSNSVQLKVPTGANWKVELVKCGGEFWLQNGWKEFADYYSLSPGSFLVFEHESGCHFNVFVFDKSATEIHYPFGSTSRDEQPNNEGEFQGTKMKETEDDGAQKGHCDGEFEEPKMEETEDDVSVEIIDDVSTCCKLNEKSPLPCPQPHKIVRDGLTTTNFGISLKKESVVLPTGACSVRISENDPTRKENTDCLTQQFKGKFEQSVLQKTSGQLPTQSFNAENKLISTYPFFKVALRLSHFEHSNLYVPFGFAKSYIKDKEQTMELQVADRSWHVKLKTCSSSRSAKLSGGWSVFARENSLQVGDVCAFEMIDNSVLKVTIFQKDLPNGC